MPSTISVLPEVLISSILSLTSPRDACRSAAVSAGFKSFADSDDVWDRFLPPDYQEIIERSVSPVVYRTKKQLYFQLSESHILIDDGGMSFMLDKRSGKKCYMIGVKELFIAWKDTPQYWELEGLPESRFSEVAKLRHVWWLEIRGKIGTHMLSLMTRYAAYLVYKTRGHAVGLHVPSKTIVKAVPNGFLIPDGGLREDGAEGEFHTAYLQIPGHGNRGSGHVPQDNVRLPRLRDDGWMEIELGEFYNGWGDDGELIMQLREVEGHLKMGLIVQGIEVRPKENA